MSQFGLIYRLEFKNVEGFTVRCNIYPTDILIPDADTPQIIALKGGDTPLVIQASNNDEDKFTQIRSKSAIIKFRTDMSAGLDSSTFSQGGDNLFKVDIYLQDTPALIFTGFLMMADNQQPFQPDPQYVTLTATDHLAALKEIALANATGENPVGKDTIAHFLGFCLNKTGLSLNINVINNLRTGSGKLIAEGVFSISGNKITLNTTTFFYAGQVVSVTNTVSNNFTYTIVSVTQLPGLTEVAILEAITVDETAGFANFIDTDSTFHMYQIVLLDAKTFEQAIGESENCYTVLNKILGEDCYITQWLGEWWVMRVDEFDDNPVYVSVFDADGNIVSHNAGTTFNKNIGRNEDHKFANADTLLRFVRPHGFVKETFNFRSPLEIPCNIDFSRGDLNTTVSAIVKDYDLDCWTKRRGVPGGYNTPITITDFIRRTFNDNGYEIDRYIYITPQTGHVGFSSTDDEYIESEGIPVNLGDKVTSSVQWRFDSNIASSSANLRLFRLVLIGDDGSGWILGENTVGDGIPIWYDTSGFTANTAKGATGVIFGNQDERDWQSIDWTAPPVPVAGTIYIWLNQAYTNAAVPSATVIHYSNLRFEYIPLINGTYTKYVGDFNRVDRTLPGYFANRDSEVFIQDSPTKIFKGAMFVQRGSGFLLTRNWFTAASFGNSYPPSMAYVHPYGYIQVYSVWNQYRGYDNSLNRGIGINIFAGSVKGLTDSWPDLLHKYSLTDLNVQTSDRYFMLISFEQNWKTCISQMTFIEVFNTVIGKNYSDVLTFKYIAE